jgi:Flp pilus assembly protein protease CpaA
MLNTIPNWLVLTIATLFLPAAYIAGFGMGDYFVHAGVAIGLMLFFGFLFKGSLAISKLTGALGLWIGFDVTLLIIFVSVALIAMGIVAVAVKWFSNSPDPKLPFLPFAALSFALVGPYTEAGASVISLI